ncbi:hypothetical protein [Polyangium sp. y55x31]|uniref:hypothetical protein n=1 Tax=Polyangium sp. y55x31 TaxID=3042688 RepID=UPI002482A3BF|nr:hypothetical protein [Polyangium sp. y55x31]MDI1481353.1 hypothetical protein [Polyangium sp. y55x31]
MSTLHKMGRALRLGFGLSLVGMFALVNGCASEDVAGESESSADQATENLVSILPVGHYTCTTGGGLILSTLVVRPGGTCSIVQPEYVGSSREYCSGAFPFLSCQDCQDLREGCFLVPIGS